MNASVPDIQILVDRLSALPKAEHGIEAQALALLVPLQRALEIRNTPDVARHQVRLRAFWMEHVPWCSNLSRELEKVLMQLEELGGTLPGGAIGG